MRILALDLATKTGWVLDKPDGNGGVEDFRILTGESKGMRFVRFERWLKLVLAGVDLVVYEHVRGHTGTDAAHIYGGLTAILQKVCEEAGTNFVGIHTSAIKKTATGKGNANKAAMIEACIRTIGITPKDDNEADARWLMFHAINVEGYGQ